MSGTSYVCMRVVRRRTVASLCQDSGLRPDSGQGEARQGTRRSPSAVRNHGTGGRCVTADGDEDGRVQCVWCGGVVVVWFLARPLFWCWLLCWCWSELVGSGRDR